jgi:hypothetical protein
MTTTTTSSFSRAGGVRLLARVSFVAVALVFASATRSVSAKVYFSETFDGTGMMNRNEFRFSSSSSSSLSSFFFLRLLGGRAHPMKARVFSSIVVFISLTFFLSDSYFH